MTPPKAHKARKMKEKITGTLCTRCGHVGAVRYHQPTQYVEEERNWVRLCPDCRKENDEYWYDMWAEHYRETL